MRVGIVGGGVAGLSAAIALGADHDVTLIERAEAFTAVGAGIVVSANAGRALRSIGVDLEGVGRRISSSIVARADGEPLQRLDLAADAARWGPTFAVSRPALHRQLVEALPSSVSVHVGCRIESVEPDRSTVVVGGAPQTFDLLVGADGINSTVRAAMRQPGRVVGAGIACWRALVEPTSEDPPTEYLGARQRVGAVGLRSGTYLYLVESAAPGALRDVDVAELRERFAGFTAVQPLLAAIGERPRFDDLAELDRPVWGSDRAVLIGDAAHAMTPNLGQGASMAIEDAIVLARRLRDDPKWFDEFVAERHRRVRWVHVTSRRLGRALHARSAPARWLRDGMLRHAPRSVTRRQTERLLAGGPAALLDSPSLGTALGPRAKDPSGPTGWPGRGA